MADYPVSIDLVRRKLLEMRDGMEPTAIAVLNMAISKLEGFPAMDVVHGRWEDATEITAGIRFPQTRCTACGKVYWGYRTECYYCPNCGAKMDAKEAEENGQEGT